MRALFITLMTMALFCSCSPRSMPLTKAETYKTLYAEKPVSIIVLPPINRSTKVEAKELFYTSVAEPLTQKGYYVLPQIMTMDVLKQESAYDAELFLNNSMKNVGKLFGVDAVLFTIIHKWTKSSLMAAITVEIEYILKSTKTDDVLFSRRGQITLNLNTSSGYPLADLVASTILTAATKEIKVGRICNSTTLNDLPAGVYSPQFEKDQEQAAGKAVFSATVK